MNTTPPISDGTNPRVAATKPPRSSNLELYRIICMLMIVAHHYVVNSGLTSSDGPLFNNPDSLNTIYLWLFGMWGKTGINCFMMITGYFMCKSSVTVRKFLKLILQIYFFRLAILVLFLACGQDELSISRVIKVILPFSDLSTNFTGCFIAFYLTIPFWNILIRHLSKRQHQLLLLLLLFCYTFLGSIPTLKISFNYVTWFGVIYVLASYIRLYPGLKTNDTKVWGWMTLASIALAMASVLAIHTLIGRGHYSLVSDSNKLLSVAVALTSFIWFKNVNIKQSKIINTIGASTFGVLLIHAHSDAMRTWLWHDIVDCVGHYSLPIGALITYSITSVLLIFSICIIIDHIRIIVLERPFFKWYDNTISERVNVKMSNIVKNQLN